MKFIEVSFHQKLAINNLEIELRPSGHMIGAAMVYIQPKSTEKRIIFSGDIAVMIDYFQNPMLLKCQRFLLL